MRGAEGLTLPEVLRVPAAGEGLRDPVPVPQALSTELRPRSRQIDTAGTSLLLRPDAISPAALLGGGWQLEAAFRVR